MFVRIGVCFLLLLFINLESKVLEFKPHQKARYHLEYTVEGNPRLEPESKSVIDLEIQILDGTGYPFTVQIDLQKVLCNGIYTQDQKLRLEYLVSTPDQVEELTGETVDPATEFSLQAFLGQLFQLNGGNVMPKRSYRLFSYYLLHDMDSPVYVGGNHQIHEYSMLHVGKVTDRELEGDWEGHSYARDGNDFEGRVDVEGTLKWNLKNPLVQQRNNTIQLIELNRNYSDGVQTTTSIRIKQKWKSS